MSLNVKPPIGARLNRSHPIAKNLVAWWLFNEGAGSSTVTDIAGNYTGTLINAPTWTSGKFGPAITFNGSYQYMSSPRVTSNTRGISVSMWLKWGGYNQEVIIFDLGGSIGFRLGEHGGCGDYGHYVTIITINLSCDATSVSSQALFPDSATWMHFVVTTDTSNIYFYVNGLLNSSTSGSINTPTYATTIGGRPANNLYFIGSIDSPMFWERKLSIDEIRQLYLNPFGAILPKRTRLIFLPTTGIPIKTFNSLSQASIKTYQGLASASVKTINSLGNV